MKAATIPRITTMIPMITAARDMPGALRFRMLKIVDIYYSPLALRSRWEKRWVARAHRLAVRRELLVGSGYRGRRQCRRQRCDTGGEVRRRRLGCKRHGAGTRRGGWKRDRRTGHVGGQLTRDRRRRYARRRLRPMGIRRRCGHIGAVGPTAAVVRSVRVIAVRSDAEIRARQWVLGPGQPVGGRRVRTRRPGPDRGERILGGALERSGRRRRCAIGEAGAIRIGEPERRQAGVAPELLGVDPALLER